jgi:hypothetical protein
MVTVLACIGAAALIACVAAVAVAYFTDPEMW